MAITPEKVVIPYVMDISNVKRQVRALQRLNKTLGKNLGKDFTKGATIVRDEITKITRVAKGIKLPSGRITNQTRQITTVLKTLNGQFITVRKTVAGYGKNLKVLNQTISKGANVARSFGQNLATLAKRAALTIPLWFALRQGIGSVFRTIKEGLTAIVDFDRALQKARRNLQGSAEDIERNFSVLRNEVTKLSLETGKSVEDITNAFQKFATVGFDFETSLAGANSATKLSILLFGDAQETATAFARSMRVLIDESKDAKPAGEQLAEVMALTSELWKTNAFELNELTASLERFAPVAKTAGISADEAVKLMAGLSTAGLRGSKAGRLLSTSLVRMVTKTDELAKSLGIKVNPEMDRTFDIFLKVLDALQKLRSETGKVSPEFEKLVKSIFGLRSGLAVKGLIALRKNLQRVLETTGDIAQFNKDFEEVNETIFQLANQFHNLNKEIGKAFVTGLVGGEDFRDSLEKIVELQEKIVKKARVAAKALVLLTKVKFGNIGAVVKAFDEIEFGGLLNVITGTKEAKDALKKQQDDILTNNERLLKGLSGQLKRVELERLIFEIETDIKLDTDKFTINKSILIKAKKALEERLQDLAPIEPTIKITVDSIEITTDEQNKLIKALIKDQLERLKLQGATESQLLKIEDRLIRQTDINDDIIAQKIRELEINRAITEEQKARISFSSESAKLAQIAKDEGIGTAKAISEVLSGQRDFNIFLRQGGERAKILKEQFADFVKQQQLLKFFTGRGVDITIKENVGQRPFTPIRAESQFKLAKARIGLKESTDKNKIATDQNTLSLKELTEKFIGFGTITGEQAILAKEEANRLTNIQKVQQRAVPQTITPAQSIVTGKQIIDLNLNISGKDFRLTASTEQEALQIWNAIKPQANDFVDTKVKELIHNAAQNRNDPIRQDLSDIILDE